MLGSGELKLLRDPVLPGDTGDIPPKTPEPHIRFPRTSADLAELDEMEEFRLRFPPDSIGSNVMGVAMMDVDDFPKSREPLRLLLRDDGVRPSLTGDEEGEILAVGAKGGGIPRLLPPVRCCCPLPSPPFRPCVSFFPLWLLLLLPPTPLLGL